MIGNKRKKYFVDRQVQGALMRRVTVYVFLVLMLMSLLSAVCFMVLEGPMSGSHLVRQMWSKLGLVWIVSLFLIPVVLIDCIRLSHRFAGPMFRLRRAMKDVADGKDVSLIRFRKGDFWYDFAEDFNRMLIEKKAAELLADVKPRSTEVELSVMKKPDSVQSGLFPAETEPLCQLPPELRANKTQTLLKNVQTD